MPARVEMPRVKAVPSRTARVVRQRGSSGWKPVGSRAASDRMSLPPRGLGASLHTCVDFGIAGGQSSGRGCLQSGA
jgi:hypothetical protein